jgi:hypothetical protein
LNFDGTLWALRFSCHDLLLVRLQLAVGPGLSPQRLNRIHDVGLLRQKGVAQIGRPTDVRV